MEKMTKRETYLLISTLLADNPTIVDFCKNEIELIDKKAARAKATAEAKRAEGDELRDVVYAVLSEEDYQPIADIAAQIDGEDVSVAKIQYRLTTLVKMNLAEKIDLKIPGVDGGKTRTVKGYRKIAQ